MNKSQTKTRDLAEIAAKVKRRKARRVLQHWSDDVTEIELISVGAGLTVLGTIRQIDSNPEGPEFMFLSHSREIKSVLDLLLWEDVTIRKDLTTQTVYLRSKDRSLIANITLRETKAGSLRT